MTLLVQNHPCRGGKSPLHMERERNMVTIFFRTCKCTYLSKIALRPAHLNTMYTSAYMYMASRSLFATEGLFSALF